MLNSLTIENFRCLKGVVTVPLNAPIVLIYGANGQGKTSIFSAIELALTGRIASLERYDADYLKHVAWRHSPECEASVSLVDGRISKARVSSNSVRVSTNLDPNELRFFRERCLLPQSLLWRLLEEYQRRETKADSPLTEFVKNLIGLDQLDALIDGLRVNGHISRIKTASPQFVETERLAQQAELAVKSLRQRVTQSIDSCTAMQAGIIQNLNRLDISDWNGGPTEDAIIFLDKHSENGVLTSLARQRRDLRAIAEQWSEISDTPDAVQVAAIEGQIISAQRAVSNWQKEVGEPLLQTLQSLAKLFPNLSTGPNEDPQVAWTKAIAIVESDLTRCANLLAHDDSLSSQQTSLASNLSSGRERLAAIDAQIVGIAKDTDDFAQSLAQLLPHIQDNSCPVCDRNFAEVSKQTLLVHVSTKLTEIRSRSSRLRALSKDRADSMSRIRQAEYQLSTTQSSRLSESARAGLLERRLQLQSAREQLQGVAPRLKEGSEFIATLKAAELKRTDTQTRSKLAVSLVTQLRHIEKQLRPDRADVIGDVTALVQHLTTEIDSRERVLSERLSLRNETISALKAYAAADAQLRSTELELESANSRLAKVKSLLAAAERVRDRARDLLRTSTDTRDHLVRSALNDHLNDIWRRLFIRLAPNEPYVPAFVKALARGSQVTLETRDRAGEPAGTPGAMLSAGNLNTAALTLFLGLHLSVSPVLPWLLLDDPVQSMDEVHVSQFAALLRTLSKEQGRQIVIAVHERPLFEYLALELSPAFDGDRLLTIELGRDADDTAAISPKEVVWKRDAAVA